MNLLQSYAIVSQDDLFFYVDRSKFSLDIDYHLRTDCFNEVCVK